MSGYSQISIAAWKNIWVGLEKRLAVGAVLGIII